MKFVFLIGLVFLLKETTTSQAQNLENIKNEKPITLHGNVNARAMFYDANGIPNRRKPFTYILSGSPTLSIYGISMPFSFIFTEQERSFRQPFNQIGVSPTYKWATLHAGYRNVSFSPYTLDGFTMLGGGFEIRPGKFYIGAMYGRLNRAVEVNQLTSNLQAVSFSRKAFAAKIGYGNDTTHAYISFLKGSDDPTSIDYKKIDSVFVTPAENLVFSAGGRIGFLKHFFVDGDAGVSIFTKNTQTAAFTDSSEIDIPNWLSSTMVINASSELNKAFRTAIGYKGQRYGINVQYRRIDPNFQSMGAYFFQNDLENYTINPSAMLWKNKLKFNGSIGIQRDNLSGRKQATARRVISSLSASATLSKSLGLDVSYSNYATSQAPIAVRFNDSLRVAQTTQNIAITPRYIITGTGASHVIIFSYNYMKLNDFSKLSAQRNLNSTTAFANYQISFIPSGISLTVGLTYGTLTSSLVNSSNRGFSFGVGKSFLKNALQLRLNNSLVQTQQRSVSNPMLTHNLTASYKANKHNAFGLNIYFLNNQGSKESAAVGGYNKFTELRADVNYNFTF